MVKLLDCTFRDGGYYNNWEFTAETVQAYISAMEALNVDFIELGFRFTPKPSFLGPCAYTTDGYIQKFDISPSTKIGVMINASDFIKDGKIDIELLQKAVTTDADISPVTLIRVACHFLEFEESLHMANFLKGKGYTVGFNLMQIGEHTLSEIEQAARIAQQFDFDVLYFADSLGNLLPNQTRDIVKSIKKEWKGDVGIHTHDNMGNAIANTLIALDEGVTWVDSTVTGMGRGPGNGQTELMAIAIKKYWDKKTNLIPLLKLVKNFFYPLKQKFGWGTNPYYYLAGEYGIHPSYIQKMIEDKRYDEEDIVAVIDFLKNNDAKSYLVKKLELAKAFYHKEPKGSWSPINYFKGRSVLILGTGPGVSEHKIAIESFIDKEKPLVMALNAKKNIEDEKIDLRVACHPIRILSDVQNYKQLSQPLVLPKSMLPEGLIDQMNELIMFDYGLKREKDIFGFGNNHCVIPNTLVIAYALAIANSGEAKKIYLAGFDGYSPGDDRHRESEYVFKVYMNSENVAPLISITASSYHIPKNSIYSLLP